MKYIYGILAILVLVTIAMLLRPSVHVAVSSPAVVINDRIISQEELADMEKHSSYHTRGPALLDSVITRELLIQEALRTGIHKEEAFRKSVENYYEQSLVKALLDRKVQEFSATVTDEMVERYRSMMGASITYTKILYGSETDAREGTGGRETTEERSFSDLSESLGYALFILPPGGKTSPKSTEEGVVVYRLDNVQKGLGEEEVLGADEVRERLLHSGQNAMLDTWMEALKKNAHIEILANHP